MKSVILSLVMIASASALAVDQNSSWSDINASYATDVKAPQVAFAAGEATSFITVFDVCVTGEILQTTKAFDVYKQVRTGGSHGQLDLVVVGQEILATPISYVGYVPKNGKNSEPVAMTFTYPLVNNIDVYSPKLNNKTSEQNLLFTKVYVIPACK